MDDLSRQLSSLSMSTNNHICNDIIVQILSWLPVNSLFRFKSVSKSWFSLITNHKFAKLHLHHHHHHHYSLTTPPQIHNPTIMFTSNTHYSLKSMDKLASSSSSSTVLEKLEMVYPFDSTKYLFLIVGSCNGLICISMVPDAYHGKEIVCLWNPSTKEFKQLPSHEDIDDAPPFKFPRSRRRSESKYTTFGLGYDHVMEDYKVIASVQWFSIMDDDYVMDDDSNEDDDDDSDEDDDDDDDSDEDEQDMYHYELKVYTLGTDSWRRIQGTPYKNEWYNITPAWSFVNGAFHRIARLYKYNVAILSFDIVEEVYREVPRPDCFFTRYEWELAVLRGCLCLCSCDPLYVKPGFRTEVWMMMNYGVEESWTKLFSITNIIDVNYSPRFKPLWFCRNGQLLMKVGHSKLVIYDPSKHNEAKLLLKSPFETLIYIASLVSLKSQKEIDKELIIC